MSGARAGLRAWGLGATVIAFGVDQADKWWMLNVFGIENRPPIRLLPVLDVAMVWNPGISYGLLRADTPAGRWLLLAVALAITGVFAVWLWRTTDRPTAIGLGFIIGGALANALDRFRYGAVADFYHFHTPFWAGPLSNYVFNLADVAIVAGVVLLLYGSFLQGRRDDAPHAA